MATDLASLPAIKLNTPAEVENDFLGKVIEKSREGKIIWERVDGGFSGVAADARLRFKLLINNGFLGTSWSLFTVSREKKEILRLENEPTSFMTLAGVPATNRHRIVSELLSFLESARTRELKTALSELASL